MGESERFWNVKGDNMKLHNLKLWTGVEPRESFWHVLFGLLVVIAFCVAVIALWAISGG